MTSTLFQETKATPQDERAKSTSTSSRDLLEGSTVPASATLRPADRKALMREQLEEAQKNGGNITPPSADEVLIASRGHDIRQERILQTQEEAARALGSTASNPQQVTQEQKSLRGEDLRGSTINGLKLESHHNRSVDIAGKPSTGSSQALNSNSAQNEILLQHRADLGRAQASDKVVSSADSTPTAVQAASEEKGFWSGIADDFGITSIGKGLKNMFIEMPKKQINSAISLTKTTIELGRKALNNEITFGEAVLGVSSKAWTETKYLMSSSLESFAVVTGALKAVGELTGVTDFYKGIKAAINGDWVSAGMHLAFGITGLVQTGLLVASVATGGLATPAFAGMFALRQGLKVAAKEVVQGAGKEFMQKAATEIGEEVVQKLAPKLSPELTKLGKEAAGDAFQQIQKQAANLGTDLAHATDLVENVCKNTAKGHLSKEVSEQIAKAVEEATLAKLKGMAGKSTKEIAAELMQSGTSLTSKEATALAKKIGKALDENIADAELVKIFSKEISKPLTELVEKTFVKSFDDAFGTMLRSSDGALREGIEKIAKQSGKSVDEVTAELQKAGRRGASRGAKETVEEAVEKGVKEAFEKLRKKHHQKSSSKADITQSSHKAGEVSQAESKVSEDMETETELEATINLADLRLKSFSVTAEEFIDGELVTVEKTYEDKKSDGVYQLTNQRVISKKQAAADSKPQSLTDNNIFYGKGIDAGRPVEFVFSINENGSAQMLSPLRSDPDFNRVRELV